MEWMRPAGYCGKLLKALGMLSAVYLTAKDTQ